MMYGNKVAAAIKVNGKVLREFKDTVYVPFGSEYTILVKNLETRRAIVNVYIDGENVVPGGLVLNALQEIELERSIKNGNLNEGNRFKFIERSGSVEQHRGVKLEDGLIRIEHEFERVYQRQDGLQWNNPGYNHSWNDSKMYPLSVGSTLRGLTQDSHIGLTCNAVYGAVSPQSMTISATSAVVNDVGVTVPGSVSDQKFQTASWFATEGAKHSMVIRLLGETADNKIVTRPITVKAKPKCVTCGRQNKATAKFCTECGTSLELVV